MFAVGVPDTSLVGWFKNKKYIIASDEGEAVAIGVGYYLATGKKPIVFMGADGFANALNPIASLIIPYKIPVRFVIGVRKDNLPQHKIMKEMIYDLISSLKKYDPSECNFTIIE